MIIALDTHYSINTAKTVAVGFNWKDDEPIVIYTDFMDGIIEYVSGQFYQRELPCILKLLEKIDFSFVEALIVDGHVFIDNDKKYGLGGHLWEALDQQIPVIGVAKNPLKGNDKITKPVYRGKSKNPLYVSSIGFPLKDAVGKIQKMHGNYRIPTLLKKLDQLTRKD